MNERQALRHKIVGYRAKDRADAIEFFFADMDKHPGTRRTPASKWAKVVHVSHDLSTIYYVVPTRYLICKALDAEQEATLSALAKIPRSLIMKESKIQELEE